MKVRLVDPVAVFANGLVPCQRGNPPDPRQVEICRRWLRACCSQRKTLNVRFSSYGLKHAAENWADDYVTNGAFIAAAIAEGYRLKATRPGGPNAFFNISVHNGSLKASAAGAGRLAVADLAEVVE